MYYIYVGELSQSCISSLGSDSVTESLLVSTLGDPEGLLNRFPFTLEALNIFPNTSQRLTETCLSSVSL